MTLGVLAGGNLGYQVLQQLVEEHDVVFTMTDSGSVNIRTFCIKKNIPCFVGNPRNAKTSNFLMGKAIDVLVSVNYLFIIENDLIKLPAILAFNVHGSLLPKYRGRTPHVWAIINGEKKTGITAHVIDEGCDTGEIIEQITIPISEIETGAGILEKYNRHYPALINKVLQNISQNTINLKKQDHSIATYFGKRTPNDGCINWDWQKERIYNWVRAQSYPYPGAFTFLYENKITVDQVQYHNLGFNFEVPNGTIIGFNKNQPIVKTPNGALELTKLREDNFDFNVNERFSN